MTGPALTTGLTPIADPAPTATRDRGGPGCARGPRRRPQARLSVLPRLLLASQLAFNVGFYLVLPFLADHLARDLELTGAMVGLVLGLRTFSQQGLFPIGGALADRYGPRPVVLTGCAVRVTGFAILGFASDLPTTLLGAVLTGFAAALFSPAVESELARRGAAMECAGTRTRTELLALFAVCGEIGAVVGPLAGALLLGVDFRTTCLAAAAVFVVIMLAHARWLPRREPSRQPAGAASGGQEVETGSAGRPTGATPGAQPTEGVWQGLREVLANRRFLAFAAANGACLLAYNQLYLALPVELDRAGAAPSTLGWLFALVSLLVITGQLPLARHVRTAWSPRRSLAVGFTLMAVGFLTVAVAAPYPQAHRGWALAPAVALVVLLTTGQMLVGPIASDVAARLAGERRLGAHLGLLSAAGGLAVLVGGTGVGALLDQARVAQPAATLPWLVLAAAPALAATAMAALLRPGRACQTGTGSGARSPQPPEKL